MVIVLLVFPVVWPVEVEGHWYHLVILFSPSSWFYSCLILMDSLRHVCTFLGLHRALLSWFSILLIVTELLNILDFRSLPCPCPDPRVSYKAMSFLGFFLQSGLENLRGWRLYNLVGKHSTFCLGCAWKKKLCVLSDLISIYALFFFVSYTVVKSLDQFYGHQQAVTSFPASFSGWTKPSTLYICSQRTNAPAQPPWWPLLDTLNFFSFNGRTACTLFFTDEEPLLSLLLTSSLCLFD